MTATFLTPGAGLFRVWCPSELDDTVQALPAVPKDCIYKVWGPPGVPGPINVKKARVEAWEESTLHLKARVSFLLGAARKHPSVGTFTLTGEQLQETEAVWHLPGLSCSWGLSHSPQVLPTHPRTFHGTGPSQQDGTSAALSRHAVDQHKRGAHTGLWEGLRAPPGFPRP